MSLEKILRSRKKEKEILLMTHIVLGYPSFEVNREVIAQMVENGVDCIEMQIPFSEPMADGPVILKANQDSLARGTNVKKCLDFGKEMAQLYDIPFLYMTYYNIIFNYGEKQFFETAAAAGIKGLIIPDLPPEMSPDFFEYARKFHIAPILIFTPASTDNRMAELDRYGAGFIYCVARRGVTGAQSEFDESFTRYLKRCREATRLPLAVGFGIRDRADIEALITKADMAVVGSETIRLVDQKGPQAVGPYISSLLTQCR